MSNEPFDNQGDTPEQEKSEQEDQPQQYGYGSNTPRGARPRPSPALVPDRGYKRGSRGLGSVSPSAGRKKRRKNIRKRGRK